MSIAVPDGASIFASWCSSMISTVSKYGAANSAKRIMSTALIAKFGTMTAFASDASKATRTFSTSSALKPLVPTTACTPFFAHHARFSRAASITVKSTATSAPAADNASAVRATWIAPPRMPSCRTSIPTW